MKKILTSLMLVVTINSQAAFMSKTVGTLLTAFAIHQGSEYLLEKEGLGQFQLQEDVRNMAKHTHGLLEAVKSLGIKGFHKIEEEVFKNNNND